MISMTSLYLITWSTLYANFYGVFVSFMIIR